MPPSRSTPSTKPQPRQRVPEPSSVFSTCAGRPMATTQWFTNTRPKQSTRRPGDSTSFGRIAMAKAVIARHATAQARRLLERCPAETRGRPDRKRGEEHGARHDDVPPRVLEDEAPVAAVRPGE